MNELAERIDRCENCRDYSWTVQNGLCKLCRGAPQKAVNPFAPSFTVMAVHKKKVAPAHYRKLVMHEYCQRGHPWVVDNIIVEGKKTRCKTCRLASNKAAYEARKGKTAIKATITQ